MLRPELALLVVIVAPFFLQRALQLTAGTPPGVRVAVVFLAAIAGAAPLAAWLIYAHHAFGAIVPNTNAAKAEFGKNSVLLRLTTVLGFGAPLIVIFAIAYPLYAIAALLRQRGGLEALANRLRAVPAAIWIAAAWALLTCVFYIVNRTYVQTRYVLVFTPALLIVIFFVIWGFKRRTLTYAAIALAALTAAGVVSLLVTRPFVGNKIEGIRKTAELAAFMQTLPPNQPVAVFAIGQIAFQSGHPIIDTGGITRPGVIPFMNEPEKVAAWAKREGALYIVQDVMPEPGAKLLFESTKPFAAWTLDLRQFSTSQRLRLWAFAPAGAASAP